MEEEILELIIKAETELPDDVLQRINELPDHPFVEAIKENVRIAKEEKRPICQDTGLLTFIIDVNTLSARDLREIKEAIRRAVIRATKEGYLRPNAIEWPHRNTENNIGPGHPHIVIRLSDEDRLRVLPKGGGSIAVSRFYTLKPIEGHDDVAKRIAETVVSAGSKACPPYFVFAAAGGTEESSMMHAKLLMLKDLRTPRRPFEESVLEKLNTLNIGVMGLGIGKTALDFRIEWLAKHPAVTSLSVIVSCRALRRASMRL